MPWFNLGRALDRKKWSMRTFAAKIGVPPQTVTRYFKKGFDPNASTLLRWCKELRCSLDSLIDKSLSEDQKLMPKPKTALAAKAAIRSKARK